MFPSEYQGFSVAVFNFSGAIMGTIFMTVLGIIAGKLNHDVEDVVVIGTNDGHVLAVGVAISYLMCSPLFICSGIEYSKGLQKLKAQVFINKLTHNNNENEMSSEIKNLNYTK